MGDGERPLVEVTVAGPEADLASGLLWDAEVSAVAERRLTDGTVVLTVALPAGGIEAVAGALGGRWPLVVRAVADDGLDAWRRWARVVPVGDRLVIRPPWVEWAARPGDVVVDIDPGRAFGHGAHPSTQLCLAEIDRRAAAGATAWRVLDVGCGSGVLAVAAAKLGAEVVAVDVDPAAITATRANAAANGVASLVSVSSPPVAEAVGRFDLVVANLGAAALVDMASDLVARLAARSELVVSGLLVDRWRPVADAFAALDLGLSAVEALDGWVALLLSP